MVTKPPPVRPDGAGRCQTNTLSPRSCAALTHDAPFAPPQVVFTDPYLDGVSPGQETAFPNAHNEALDAVVTEMRSDFELKLKVHLR